MPEDNTVWIYHGNDVEYIVLEKELALNTFG